MTESIKIETNEDERKATQAELRKELDRLADDWDRIDAITGTPKPVIDDLELFVSLLRNGRTSGHDQR